MTHLVAMVAGEDIQRSKRSRADERLPALIWAGASDEFGHPGMWRVRWPDGRLSDITNLTRAKGADASFMETEERRQLGRPRSLEDCLGVKTGEMPAGGALVPASGEHRVVASENEGARHDR
jgi:hypothetical protein